LISIPSCIEVIRETAFENWSNFDAGWDFRSNYANGTDEDYVTLEVSFEPGSRLKILGGFNDCAIESITIPASVEVISGFNGVISGSYPHYGVQRVLFEANSHLKRIDGFSPPAFSEITIPDSVEIISKTAFRRLRFEWRKGPGAYHLDSVLFGPDSRLREVHGFRGNSSELIFYLPDSVEVVSSDSSTWLRDDCAVKIIVSPRSSLARVFGRYEDKTWPQFWLGWAAECLDLTCIRSQFIRDLISTNQIYDLKTDLIWTRKKTGEWYFSVNEEKDLCVVDEPVTTFSNLPKVLKSGTKTFTVSLISDSLFCDCSSRSIEIPSCIKVITQRWKDTNSTIQRIEIGESIEKIVGFWDFEHLQTVVFQQNCHVRKIGGFRYCDSLNRIEIPMSIEEIDHRAFYNCKSLREIVFSSNSHLRSISGFQYCRALCRIDIPPSVETIAWACFSHCTSLTEVNISRNSQLKKVHGFRECKLIHRFEVEPLVETFDKSGLVTLNCLREVVFRSGVKIQTVERFMVSFQFKANNVSVPIFIGYEDDTFMKNSRRRVHVGTCLGNAQSTKSMYQRYSKL
jgi:hypothetical protein